MRVFDIPAGSIPMLKTGVFSATLNTNGKYIFNANRADIMQADANSPYLFDSVIYSINYTPQDYTEAQQAASNTTAAAPLKCVFRTKSNGQKLQQLPEGIPVFPAAVVPLSGFWWLDSPDILQAEILGELGTVSTIINTLRVEFCLSVYRISDAQYIQKIRRSL